MKPISRHKATGAALSAVVAAVIALCGWPSEGAEEKLGGDEGAAYTEAVQAAQQRFRQRVAEAQEKFLEEVQAAQKLREARRSVGGEAGEIGILPVSVPGADPVPLVEGTGKKGWFEIPAAAQQAVIFQTRESEPKDGVLEFSVTRDATIGLAASWAYDGNPGGGWQAERETKQDLIDAGWRSVGEMYFNLTDRHTIFLRECRAGESFRIRTRKYYRPVVLIQDAFDEAPAPPAVGEDVVVEVPAATSQPVEKLLPRENTHEAILGTTAYVSPLTGVAIVRVHRRCMLYVAASWAYDGNTSGQWTEERWSEEMFADRGFKEIGAVTIRHRGSDQPHKLFARECDQGESFRIRTRKYGAPYVFVSSGG